MMENRGERSYGDYFVVFSSYEGERGERSCSPVMMENRGERSYGGYLVVFFSYDGEYRRKIIWRLLGNCSPVMMENRGERSYGEYLVTALQL